MADQNDQTNAIQTQAMPKRITLEALTQASQRPAAQTAIQAQKPAEPAVTLTPEELAEAQRKAAAIDLTKSGIESSYARDSQMSMSSFSDDVLSKVANKDDGEAGKALQELLTDVDEADLSGVKRVPILGQVVVSVDKLRRRYQKVAPQIDEVVERLERCRAQMVSDITMYDAMYQRNVQQYRQLKVDIAAGRMALDEFRTNQLPQLEAEAQASSDPMSAQVLKDFKDKLARFDKRLDDLDRVSVVSLQMAPQIKILQNADREISDKVDTTISTTIPLWKSQMVIALGLQNQRRALELQQKVDDTTNKLLRANAEALHQGAIDAEKASQRGTVDIQTLQQVNDQLISTLRETVQIQQQGQAERQEAQAQMRQIESDLKQALIENAAALR
ncbi:MAG: toxic anion resistance protein [Atopobiaceae bacterium]